VDDVHDVSRPRRIALSALLIVMPAAVMASVFSDPRTPETILSVCFLIVTAPFQSAWWFVRSTGPVRRTIILFLFVVLPVVLLPAYAARPKTTACVATLVGAVLWLVSGFLMVALRSVD
jgi:hypothetical protein